MKKFTTPTGVIYIRKDAVVAVAETEMSGKNKTIVKTQLWVDYQAESFNLLEDVDAVMKSLFPYPEIE